MDLPHFSLPLRLDRTGFAVSEQDTADDIATCVWSILLCPRGFRAELPEFGVVDPTFAQTLPDAEAMSDAVAEWEPRAQAAVSTEADEFDASVAHVRVRLGLQTEN